MQRLRSKTQSPALSRISRPAGGDQAVSVTAYGCAADAATAEAFSNCANDRCLDRRTGAPDPDQTLSVQVSSRSRQAQTAGNGELSRAAVCAHPPRKMRRVTAQTRSQRVSSDSPLFAIQWRILDSKAMPSGCLPHTDRQGQRALLTGLGQAQAALGGSCPVCRPVGMKRELR